MSIEFRENASVIERYVVLIGFYTAKEWGKNVDPQVRDEFVEQYPTIEEKKWVLRGINTYRRREGWEELQINLEGEE